MNGVGGEDEGWMLRNALRLRASVARSCAVVAACWLVTSCGARSTPDDALAQSVGPKVRSLWAAHGGYEKWRQFRGIAFDYKVRFADGRTWERPISILFDELRSVRVGSPSRESSGVVSRREDDSSSDARSSSPSGSKGDGTPALAWTVVPLGHATGQPVHSVWAERDEAMLADGVSPALLDFALLSLRNLAQLPFGLASPGWEMRQVISPGLQSDLSGEIEAKPVLEPVLLGPYLIRWEEAGDLDDSERNRRREPLASLFYASTHTARPTGVFEVRFTRHATVDGIVIPVEREHFQRVPVPDSAYDPLNFTPAPSADDETPVLVESLSNLRFLSASEAKAMTGEEDPESDEAATDEESSKAKKKDDSDSFDDFLVP